MTLLHTNIHELSDGETVVLYPNAKNPLHSKPIKATYAAGYFYCEGSDPANGPDYYAGDVLSYNNGWIPQ